MSFISQDAPQLPPGTTNTGPVPINPPFHGIRQDMVRFRNQVRHIQLINADQHLVDRLWKHLHVNLARFRNENRRARRFNGIILRQNLQNRLRNDRNMLRRSTLQMEDQIYRENANLFRNMNLQARRFENQTLTNTTAYFNAAKERASTFDSPDVRDIFY